MEPGNDYIFEPGLLGWIAHMSMYKIKPQILYHENDPI